ncbi:MAG: hypothetical protein AAF689_16575 [Pseudomonadota bacterium]
MLAPNASEFLTHNVGSTCISVPPSSDYNGDDTLTSADAEFAKFNVLVTKADGTAEVKTFAQPSVTEIDQAGDSSHVELPDGSLINNLMTPI